MATYRVALWVQQSNGREDREDMYVDADDRNDAVREASSRLARGLEVKKVISVEKVSD